MRMLALVVLALLSLSAMGVVYNRHQHRLSYVALKDAQRQRDALNTEWRLLLLEQSTWAFHHRVETRARKRLRMSAPDPNSIVVVEAR